MGWFGALLVVGAGGQAPPEAFTNWEHPPVHPLDLSADGRWLAVCNLADHRVEFFELTSRLTSPRASVPVGLDPVSVRFETSRRLWVVNHVSDSVSILDLVDAADPDSWRVSATIQTLDEPCDVVFAGTIRRAFVSCSQANVIQVFDPVSLGHVADVALAAEDPRALATSPDGRFVYVAIFESGNRTTVIRGGSLQEFNARLGANDPEGPYGGVNPPPNDGSAFRPPIAAPLPTPPPSSIIVRKGEDGGWRDDNGGDWTRFVSGDKARVNLHDLGWDMPDRDVALVDTVDLSVRYATGLMNLCMSLAVHPVTGEVHVVGTDATNEIRFEPNLRGRFLRVQLGRVDPLATPARRLAVHDLNPHLTYTTGTIPQAERDLSLGDPRGIVWNLDGSRGYVTGMGSNNMIVIDATGRRLDGRAPIELGEGPTGVVFDADRDRLYVLNRFEATVSVVDAAAEREIARLPFHDSTPEVIRRGRPHLYNTRRTSGLGHIACASCHVDARMDRLGWDLGDPSGEMKSLANRNLGNGMAGLSNPALFDPYHPMKGVMTTQTLQDIIGHEPFHWRGDRDGLEEFNGAFMFLQGDDEVLTPEAMQAYEDFLATIAFPPNPYRNFDNTLPEELALPGHYATGRFAGQTGGLRFGDPLPSGNARRGVDLYLGRAPGDTLRPLDGPFTCAQCHTLPTGMQADMTLVGGRFVPLAVGPLGEHHLGIIGNDGSANRNMKTPQLRNLYDKVGFENFGTTRAGFGFAHDGRVPTLASFVSASVFSVRNDQEVADLVALMLAFVGSDLPYGSDDTVAHPPGPASKDTHAAVGRQVTVFGSAPVAAFGRNDAIAAMIALASAPEARVEVIAKGLLDGVPRGWVYDPAAGRMLSDRRGEARSVESLRNLASPAAPITWTIVPNGSGRRLGVDRDSDGYPDLTERLAGSDPADPSSVPRAAVRGWPVYR